MENPKQLTAQSNELDNAKEELLPAKNALGEPNGYVWTEITDEFFESVKGTLPLVFGRKSICFVSIELNSNTDETCLC